MTRKGIIIFYLKAKEVRLELAHMNKTQRWMAEKMHVSPQYVSQLMNRARTVGPKTRSKISGVLKPPSHETIFEMEEARK